MLSEFGADVERTCETRQRDGFPFGGEGGVAAAVNRYRRQAPGVRMAQAQDDLPGRIPHRRFDPRLDEAVCHAVPKVV